ncbi:histone-lysine N-methyltransferase SETMAR [Trichonephila inaurata madagascariensis]|uniref:Histone-lysine N-methyltransferase SETMAR n=1 Tax=Trichonephila inaurata madagascariensis TaxID=2747483 RepID=A0A8X6I903_9ARAC|nr:histone-lysine N-methyltransferase SETMAR [Trichonephila inaurata madagascariensis]
MERRCVLNLWSKEEVRAVIRYEWARRVSGTEIHNRLVEVYMPGVMSKQMERRWCHTFSDGRQQVEDIPRAGRTRTATTDANVGKVDDMIRANRRITIDAVAEELGISHERAQNIIHDILRYRKVSARWTAMERRKISKAIFVPDDVFISDQDLISDYIPKKKRKTLSSEKRILMEIHSDTSEYDSNSEDELSVSESFVETVESEQAGNSELERSSVSLERQTAAAYVDLIFKPYTVPKTMNIPRKQPGKKYPRLSDMPSVGNQTTMDIHADSMECDSICQDELFISESSVIPPLRVYSVKTKPKDVISDAISYPRLPKKRKAEEQLVAARKDQGTPINLPDVKKKCPEVSNDETSEDLIDFRDLKIDD